MDSTAKRQTADIAPVLKVPDRVQTRIGTLEFTHDFANGFPSDATVEKLYDERDFQRACQAYLWSPPAVAFTAFQRGLTKGLAIWTSKPPGSR